MIPLFLITGFLGSGKTTLLRHLVEQTRGRRYACIVNEFSAVDVDGQLVDLPAGQLVSIPGGSIFCRCLVGEFIRSLQQVAKLGPQGVLIEASGIADPKVIAQMLAETRLDEQFELRQIVTLVDPGSFLKLVQTLPNIVAQVEASDRVLINKADLYGAEQLEACEAHIREINPYAVITRTEYGRVGVGSADERGELERIGGAEPRRSVLGEYARCADPNYHTRNIRFEKLVDRDQLRAALQALQPHVYRAKGFVPTPSELLYVDVSAAGVYSGPASQHLPANATDGSISRELVIIAAPAACPHVDAFVRTVPPGADFSLL